MHSFAVHTLGCKVNQYETEIIANDFLEQGYRLVDFSDHADVYVINTCTVTAKSDHKSRQWITKALRNNPDALIAVTGCYADRAEEALRNLSGVDLVVGNRSKDKIAKQVSRKLSVRLHPRQILSKTQHFHTRALLKVVDGCDNFCSFCVVPYVRGRPVSRSLSEIVAEAQNLCQSGVKEIVVTGINLGKFGKDLKPQSDLVDLLQALPGIKEIARIRLSSIEVTDLGVGLIELLSSSQVFCRHLHIPLQSGDDQILKEMNRNYSADQFMEVAGILKEKIPGIALTTDVMVGFPGESEEQFKKTKAVMEQVAFRKAHIFQYSERPMTKASNLSDKVNFQAKERHSRELIELSQYLAQSYIESFIGNRLDVLVEKADKQGYLTGITDNYIRVRFPGDENLKGSLVNVLIEGRQEQTLQGRII